MPLLDGSHECLIQVVQVDKRITVQQVTWIEVTGQILFINPLDLMGERNGVTLFIVYACQSEYDYRNFAMLLVQYLFGFYFRLGILPRGIQWPILIDGFTRLGGLVYQVGAGEDELLNIETLKGLQKVRSMRPGG